MCERDHASLGLSWAMVSIGPELEVVIKNMVLLVQVFDQDVLVPLIAVKPFVSKLLVSVRVVVPSVSRLTYARWSMDPDAFDVVGLSFDSGVVLGDLLEFAIVLDSYMVRDLIDLALFGLLPDLFPVGLAVELHWLGAELPRAFDSRVFFQAVGRCSVVDLDRFKVSVLAVLLQARESHLSLGAEVELNVKSSVCALLELAVHIGEFICPVPGSQVLFW